MPDFIPEIRERVRKQRDEIASFLKDFIETNSYSRNFEGINRVGEMVYEKMPHRLDHAITTDRNGVNHHVYSTGAQGDGRNLALVGHIDTVFPPDSVFQKFADSDGRLHGPGISDMKSGVAVIVYALRVLDDMKLLDSIPVRCLINGDEEIGSPNSRPLIRKLARWASYGLVFECAGLKGEVVSARRGIRRFALTVTGEAHHAGVWKGPKASAVLELSRMIMALEALNDREKKVSLNVGKISGGTASNVIPDLARASFEFRFWDKETENEVLGKIKEIVDNPENPECYATIKCHHRRPAAGAINGADRLYSLVSRTAGELDQEMEQEMRGGASDANFLIDAGVPALDGMGPIGDMDHSLEEYILKESLFERIELTALLMTKLRL
ncbi:MAG: M20 family metallopeptidase [bacterium]